MKSKSCLLVLWSAALPLMLSGCGEEAPAGMPHTHHPEAELTLCGRCGEIKGSDKCCQSGVTGVPLCPKCGLHVGSILDCSPAINGRRDVILCRKCGEVAFSKKCCQSGVTGVPLCPKCGLHKGSPGDCKIEKFVGDDAAHQFEHSHAGDHAHHG